MPVVLEVEWPVVFGVYCLVVLAWCFAGALCLLVLGVLCLATHRGAWCLVNYSVWYLLSVLKCLMLCRAWCLTVLTWCFPVSGILSFVCRHRLFDFWRYMHIPYPSVHGHVALYTAVGCIQQYKEGTTYVRVQRRCIGKYGTCILSLMY